MTPQLPTLLSTLYQGQTLSRQQSKTLFTHLTLVILTKLT